MPKSISEVLLGLVSDDYESIVNQCADNSYGLMLPNSSIKHAGVLTRAIFRNATDKVEIYSGNLNETFLCDVEDSIRETMKAKPHLQVEIVLAHTKELNNTASHLKAEVGERLKFFCAKSGYDGLQHFTVSGNMYRLEKPHSKDQNFKKEPAVSAEANFNGVEGAKVLHQQFSDAKGALLS